jgi:hypothetical protein
MNKTRAQKYMEAKAANAAAKADTWEKIQKSLDSLKLQLGEIDLETVHQGVKVKCNGNQENYQLEVEGVPFDKLRAIEEAVNLHCQKIIETAQIINKESFDAAWETV